jgi:hypothetical protein
MARKLARPILQATMLAEHRHGRHLNWHLRDKLVHTAHSGLVAVEPLWVCGLVLLCLLLGHHIWSGILGLGGEAYDWAQYLTLGIAVPVAVVALALIPVLRQNQEIGQRLRQALALTSIALSIVLIGPIRPAYILFLILGLALWLMLTGRDKRHWINEPIFAIVGTGVAAAAWALASHLQWWLPLEVWLSESGIVPVVLVLSVLLSVVGLQGARGTRGIAAAQLVTPANLAALLLLAVVSTRSDQLFRGIAHHHWSAVVGPATLVRQGHWLLWDVPSQYGFLSTLAIVYFPGDSVWQSFYVLNAVLMFLTAAMLFFLLRSLGHGPWSFLLSLATAIAAVSLVVGWPQTLAGPQATPAVGPFRFFWCYALLAVLLWEFVSNARKRFSHAILFGGTCIWLVGTFWSIESAAYCAAVWLPAYVLIVLRETRDARSLGTAAIGARHTLLWLLLPVAMLFIAIVAITAFYLVSLGQTPDWFSYVEYSVSFVSLEASVAGIGGLPIAGSGPVWMLLLVFFALTTVVAYLLQERQLAIPPALVGAWGAFWATSSYFVSRSHPVNASNLAPTIFICAAIGLFVTVHVRTATWWARLVWVSLIPVFAILLATSYGNVVWLDRYLRSQHLAPARDVAEQLPLLDASLVTLMQSAGVNIDDPIVFLDETQALMLAWPQPDNTRIVSPRYWLPVAPSVLYLPLPAQQSQRYVERFIDRNEMSGWLIQRRTHPRLEDYPWLARPVSRHYAATKVFEQGDWQLIWFEIADETTGDQRTTISLPAATPLPELATDRETAATPAAGGCPANIDFASAVEGRGWSVPETAPDGSTFTWSTARVSTLDLGQPVDQPFALEARVRQSAAPNILESLRVRVNGRELPLQWETDAHGGTIVRVLVPEDLLRRTQASTLLAFLVDRTIVPTGEARSLGLAFDWLHFDCHETRQNAFSLLPSW